MFDSHYQKFQSFPSKGLQNLKGEQVQINLGGPEKGVGTLSKIGLDFCVLESQDGIYYYQLHHIKSFTLLGKNNEEESKDKESKKSNKDENKKSNKEENKKSNNKKSNKDDENKKSSNNHEENKDEKDKKDKVSIVWGRLFTQIIDSLRGEEIQINRGGPQKVKGIVEGHDKQFIFLKVEKETLLIPIFHIQNICCNIK